MVGHRPGAEGGEHLREGVVAVGARNLLDQVDLAQRVLAAVPRNLELQGVPAPPRDSIPERGQQLLDLAGGEVHAEHMRHPGGAERDSWGHPRRGANVNDLPVQPSAGGGQRSARRLLRTAVSMALGSTPRSKR